MGDPAPSKSLERTRMHKVPESVDNARGAQLGREAAIGVNTVGLNVASLSCGARQWPHEGQRSTSDVTERRMGGSCATR